MIYIYTNKGLVEYVKKWLNYPTYYGWGCWGQKISDNIIAQKSRQYPEHYDAARRIKLAENVGKAWLIDCVGLIKGYYWDCVPGGPSVGYSSSSDVSADGMYSKATCKGPIDTIPNVPGICVHMDNHIGIYIGNGEVIESTKGIFGDGVVQTKLSDRQWKHWLQCPYIIYGEVNLVEPSDWAKEAWAWAVEKGICANDNPHATLTKEQVVFMLYQAFKGGK